MRIQFPLLLSFTYCTFISLFIYLFIYIFIYSFIYLFIYLFIYFSSLVCYYTVV